VKPRLVTRTFSGRILPAEGTALDPTSDAALRQFSLERLMAYGVVYADACELRGRVSNGEDWVRVAAELARTCLSPPELEIAPESSATKARRLYRASALTRMSQVMMLEDTAERRDVFERAAVLYKEAAAITNDREPVQIPTRTSPLAGWYFATAHGSRACAIVIGGVEGWAMDFDAMALAFAARGIDTLLLDGPGQGESRFTHRHYLSHDWLEDYKHAVDYVESRIGSVPIGIVGNSMGGTFALQFAALEPRIVACCDNGGTANPMAGAAAPTFFKKMLACCGDLSEVDATAIWEGVRPSTSDASFLASLLVVHGGSDPLVAFDDAASLFEGTQATDKGMLVYSDGDHCVYNHADDKHDLIADWMSSQLLAKVA